MITPELVNYLKQQLAQGATQVQLTAVLAAQGWPQSDIQEAFHAASGIPTPPPAPAPAPMTAIANNNFSGESAAAGLQRQYPLSPRKFWKKMINHSFFSIFLLVIIIPTAWVAVIAAGSGSTGWIDLVIFLLLAFIIVDFIIYGLYISAYIKRYYYDANNSFVTIKKGVFAPAEIHVQYSKIQDVYVDQDILDRIMGLYDVHLASATVASGIEAHIDGVDAAGAQGLKEFLLGKLRSGGSSVMSSGMNSAPAGGSASMQPVTFSGDISSTTYPIVGRWLVQQAIVWVFTSALYSAFIVFYFAVKSKDSVSGSVLTGSFIGLFVITYIFHIVYNLLWRSTFSFSFLPDYIVTKSGIISKSETHLPYRSVQDVNVSQGIIERMFGLATVRIENAAQMVGPKGQRVSSAIRLPGQPLAKANEISNALRKVVLTHSSAGTGL